MLFPLLSLLLTSIPLISAKEEDFILGRINDLDLSVSPSHPFLPRDCPGAPYTNTFCCGPRRYCFNSEVCCDDGYYCCPGGTTCLGSLRCSNGGSFTATGSLKTSATIPPVPTFYTPPPLTYMRRYYFTITYTYYSYSYTFDTYYETTSLLSYQRTTWSYFTVSATDSAAASASFVALSATASLDLPGSETAATPITISSTRTSSRRTSSTSTTTTSLQLGGDEAPTPIAQGPPASRAGKAEGRGVMVLGAVLGVGIGVLMVVL